MKRRRKRKRKNEKKKRRKGTGKENALDTITVIIPPFLLSLSYFLFLSGEPKNGGEKTLFLSLAFSPQLRNSEREKV